MSNQSSLSSTIIVQRLLDRLESGDPEAPQRLLEVTMQRLRVLASKIQGDIPGLQRWEELDDLLQNSSLRLWKALQKHNPATPLDYFRLAAAIIRRELIDLSRHYFGPQGLGANQAKSRQLDSASSPVNFEVEGSSTYNPEQLCSWTEFHDYVDQLPDEQRVLYDLLWYQELTLDEAAQAIGSSERTVRRNWRSARINLYRQFFATEE